VGSLYTHSRHSGCSRARLSTRESCGAPRVHLELLAQKAPRCRNTVGKLMRRAEILPKAIRRFRVTTDSRQTKGRQLRGGPAGSIRQSMLSETALTRVAPGSPRHSTRAREKAATARQPWRTGSGPLSCADAFDRIDAWSRALEPLRWKFGDEKESHALGGMGTPVTSANSA
jgi:hypothetical protein